MAPPPHASVRSGDAPAAYVGLTEESAGRRARENGWKTVRSLPPGSFITLEHLADRLNFEVRDGAVVRCWAG